MWDDKIKRFPQGTERRERLNLAKNRVHCEISERWLQFPKIAHALSYDDFVRIDVMTIGSNGEDRKICELVLNMENLLRMIGKVTIST